MAVTQLSAEIMAPPETVYDVVSDPGLFPDWDATYESASRIRPNREGEPAFEARRTLANRGIHLVCHVESALPGRRFAFTCNGDEGEQIQEIFDLAPARDGAATTFTRTFTYTLPGRDLGVVDDTTFDEAMNDRSVEQAFARLNTMFGSIAAAPVHVPGDTGSARAGSGGFNPAERAPTRNRGE